MMRIILNLKSALQNVSFNYRNVFLLIIIISTSLFILINSIFVGIICFVLSLIILLCVYYNTRILRFKFLFILVLVTTTVSLFLGNFAFSPDSDQISTYKFLFFRFNELGAEQGIIGVLKRNSMIVLSYAWLCSIRGMSDAYDTFYIYHNNNYRKYLTVSLRLISIQANKLRTQYLSLKLRSIEKSRFNIMSRLKQSKLQIFSIVNRFFFDIGKLTYAGEIHSFSSDFEKPSHLSIDLNGVSVRYNQNEPFVINKVDLEVHGKSFLFLSGVNKAGKSTLMKIISGYIPKITGELFGQVNICGIDFSNDLELSQLSPFVKHIMDDPDDYIIGLTVEHEIMMHTNDREFALECLSDMEIKNTINQETSSLSGGQKIRLVLACLLI